MGGSGNDTVCGRQCRGRGDELAARGPIRCSAAVTDTLLPDIENLTLTGSSALAGTGNALGNVLTGNSGANVLTGLGGNDTLEWRMAPTR